MSIPGAGWCLIESDPGVFSSLVERIGVKGVSFTEVYGLDEDSFAALEAPDAHRKVLGFIFLFNWAKDKHTIAGEDTRPTVDPASDDAPFFAAQVSSHVSSPVVPHSHLLASLWKNAREFLFISVEASLLLHLFLSCVVLKAVENACASQAILAVLLNRQSEVADLGSALTGLYKFTKDFRDPAMRGEAIGSWCVFFPPASLLARQNVVLRASALSWCFLEGLHEVREFYEPGDVLLFSEAIREAHNSFRAETSFEVLEVDDAKSKDAFHFVSYVPKGDKVFELDGLKQVAQALLLLRITA